MLANPMKPFLAIAAFVALCLPSFAYADTFEIKEIEGGLEVLKDGKLLTRYLTKSGAKPVLLPLASTQSFFVSITAVSPPLAFLKPLWMIFP